MTSLADRTIAALRAEHEALVRDVTDLDDAQLVGPSGAAQWTVADVLSHLGSGAVITRAGLRSATGAEPAPGDGFNEAVWDRWNAMSPAEQRAGFLESDAQLVEVFEALDERQCESLTVQVGFRPAPVSIAAFGGIRLNEAAQHSWDIRVASEPAAGIAADSAAALAELLSNELAFLVGYIGKADQIDQPVRLEIARSGYGLTIADSVALVTQVDQPTAVFSGPLEAAIRLIAGRLGPAYTPNDVSVTGNITLEDLRTVFPGY